MKNHPFFFILLILTTSFLQAQSDAYKTLCLRADTLLNAGFYPEAANTYSRAFQTLGWKGTATDRYNAARSWARAGVPDSAFFQLKRILEKMDYLDASNVWMVDADFLALKNDGRWKEITAYWAAKKEKNERIKSNPLSIELECIYELDQKYRTRKDSVVSLHGAGSPPVLDWVRRGAVQDSINLIRVEEILAAHGWLGEDQISNKATRALWLVVQHAPLAVQEKYLPLMQAAVQAGKASASNLAYLEDRILMRRGKPQRYGSQLRRGPDGGWVLHEVEDPERLNERRKLVGLGPIEEYLKQTGAISAQF